MAEERNIILKVELDPSQAVDGLKQVDDGLKKVDDDVKKIKNDSKELGPFEQKLADINKQVNSGELNFQQLRKTIKDYQGIAFEAGRTSPVGKQALADAAALQDRMTDLDNEVKRLAHDGANLQAAMQLGQGVLAGFTAFKGVTAALGIENENLMKTMTQLQGASSALMAVEQLRASLEKESFLMIKAKAIATKGLAAVTVAYTTVQKALNVAMKANPIGLIIIAITALVGAFILLKDEIKGVIDWFANFAIGVLSALGLVENKEAELEAQRVANNEEAEKRHKQKIAQLKEERDEAEKVLDQIKKRQKLNEETTSLELLQAKARGASEEELFQIQKQANNLKLEMAKQELEAKAEIMRINREMAQAEYDRWKTFLETQALMSGFTEDQVEKELARLEEVKIRYEEDEAAQIASNERALATLEAQNTIFENDRKKKRSADAKNRAKEDKKESDARLKQAEKERSELEKAADELFKRRQSAQKRLDQMIRDENADAFQLRINQLQDQHEKEMELLSSNVKEEAALRIQLENALQDEIKRIKDEAAQADTEARQAQLEAEMEQIIEVANMGLAFLDDVNAILNEIGDRRKAAIQSQRDAELQLINDQKSEELRILEESNNNQLENESLTSKQKKDIKKKTAFEKAEIEHKFAMQEFKTKKEAAEAEDKIARRQFQRNKALKIAEIAINTAAAVMQALATFPPPASFVVAGITGAIGVAQAAIVASTKFQGTASSIQPPTFTAPNIDSGGGSESGAGGSTGGGLQDDITTDLDDINTTTKVVISQVEINETQDQMANVQDVATV